MRPFLSRTSYVMLMPSQHHVSQAGNLVSFSPPERFPQRTRAPAEPATRVKSIGACRLFQAVEGGGVVPQHLALALIRYVGDSEECLDCLWELRVRVRIVG